jgi:hypothetical protein
MQLNLPAFKITKQQMLLLLFGAIISLLLAEVALHFLIKSNFNSFIQDDSGKRYIMVVEDNAGKFAFLRFNPTMGWELSKGVSGYLAGARGEYYNRIIHDNLGHRNLVASDSIIPGKTIFLGDSFTWGTGVDAPDSFTYIYQEKTGEKTYNFGTPGYGTDQELQILRENIVLYKPKKIVLHFNTATDFSDNYIKDKAICVSKTYFELQGSSLNPATKPARCPMKTYHILEITNSLNLADLLKLRLVDLGAYIVSKYEYPLFKAIGWKAENSIYLEIYEKNEGEDAKKAFEITEELLASINTLAKANNATLVVSIIPDKIEVGGGAYKSIDPAKYDLDKPAGVVKKIGEKYGFVVLDPFFEFRQKRDGGSLYYEVDGHITKEGSNFYAGKLVSLVGN